MLFQFGSLQSSSLSHNCRVVKNRETERITTHHQCLRAPYKERIREKKSFVVLRSKEPQDRRRKKKIYLLFLLSSLSPLAHQLRKRRKTTSQFIFVSFKKGSITKTRDMTRTFLSSWRSVDQSDRGAQMHIHIDKREKEEILPLSSSESRTISLWTAFPHQLLDSFNFQVMTSSLFSFSRSTGNCSSFLLIRDYRQVRRGTFCLYVKWVYVRVVSPLFHLFKR